MDLVMYGWIVCGDDSDVVRMMFRIHVVFKVVRSNPI